MKRLGLLVLVLVLLVAGVVPAIAQDGSSRQDQPPPLLAMLGMVPDNDLVQGQGWATVRYADFQALYTSEGVEDMRLLGNTPMLLKLVPLPGMLMRIVAGPEALQRVFTSVEQMQAAVGFEWIASVDRSLEFGTPPDLALILDGRFDADAIGAVLSARDFEETDVSGVPVWHRFEDAQVNIQDRDTADPFGGDLGMAARIAVMPPYLANSRYWDTTKSMIAAAQGDQPSLADNPNYRARAEAVTAPDGLLIQAMFFDGADLGVLPDNPGATLTGQQDAEDPTANYGPLMPYALAVLADWQEGQDQVHLIGLVYPNADTAGPAAEEVAKRIQAFALPGRTDTLVQQFGAQVSSRVYTSDTTGQAVAVVEVRYPLPADRKDAATGQFIAGGLMFRNWAQAIMRRAFFVLEVKAE
jgi:hypothetical protein